MLAEQKQALDTIMAKINKDYCKGTVMMMGERSVAQMPHISSGCMSIDSAMGIGGYPKGRIIEIYGPESSGKTTVCLHAVAEAQKAGGVAAYIDAEHALDPGYAKNLGVNVDEMIICQPDYGEQAIDVAEKLISSNSIQLLVVDSVAALVPKAELEGEMIDASMGLQARLMAKAMRRIVAAANKSQCVVIFINQIREKIGVMYGNPETTCGGRALKFAASVRMEIRRVEDIKDGTNKIGVKTKCKIVKNKVAPPFKEVFFEIYFGKGISFDGDLVEIALDKEIIEKGGAWLRYAGESIQGKEKFKELLASNPKLKAQLIKDVNAAIGNTIEAETLVNSDEPDATKKKKSTKKPTDDEFDIDEV